MFHKNIFRSGVGVRVLGANLALLLPILSTQTWAEGFRCPPLTPSAYQSPAYKAEKEGGPCEGFYELHISSPFIELMSLTYGGNVFASSEGPIKLFTASGDHHLVVLPLLPGIPYRADLASTESGTKWDPKTMLKNTGLRTRDLGFLALTRSSTESAMELTPISDQPPKGADKCTAVVRTSVPTSEVRWRIYAPGSGANSESRWTALPVGQLEKWEFAVIDIPLPADGRPFIVEVEAKKRDRKSKLPVVQFRVVSYRRD